MVPMAAAVVADGVADGFIFDGRNRCKQCGQLGVSKLRLFRESIGKSGDVGRMVFAMVNFHGARIEVRLEHIVGIREFRQGWRRDFGFGKSAVGEKAAPAASVPSWTNWRRLRGFDSSMMYVTKTDWGKFNC